jgi:hypothetical protein
MEVYLFRKNACHASVNPKIYLTKNVNVEIGMFK